jgi:glycosyltransferase involved in cell wall biosynthesis/peptidoglycan/xylan/chitin deacetylase (PgdA/CDA1 family)
MVTLEQSKISAEAAVMGNAPSGTTIACVCGGYGFPHGTATTQRILLVGQALVEAGCRFTVWHCGPSPMAENTELRGEYRGIEFEYLGQALHRPRSRWRRLQIYLRAMLELPARIRGLRGHGCVYLYPQGMLGLYAGALCRLMGVPVVQELGEWWEGIKTASWITRLAYRGPLFWFSSGALAISDEIARRVLEHTWTRKSYGLYKLPAVADPQSWNGGAPRTGARTGPATFLWCGVLSSYLADIRSLVQSLAQTCEMGVDARLVLSGPCDSRARECVARICAELRLDPARVVLPGYVSQAELARLFQSADALVLPMHDDDRSWTRSPNKLPEYLASGAPVITSPTGDIGAVLRDGETAYFVEPDDPADMARAMCEVARHPEEAQRIGLAGRAVCHNQLDYRFHSQALAEFFHQIGRPRAAASTGPTGVERLRLSVRKAAGWAISSLLIASGAVRRRWQRTGAQPVVTPVYLHNPSPKVFRACVEHLRAAGCTFVSLEQVRQFISGEAAAPPRAVWLSCDDGWKEIRYTMIPLLRRYRVPMTIFMPTTLAQGGPGWWRVCRIFRRELATLGVQDPHQLWEMPDRKRREVLDALCKMVDTRALGDDFLSPEQIREIAQYPEITFGSHSCSHPILWQCTPEEAQFEMEESKRILEEWTGRPVTSFAYPFGAVTQRVAGFARAAGYTLAATTALGAIRGASNAFLLPRFCVSDEMSVAEVICSSSGVWPELSASLKRWLPSRLVNLLAFSVNDDPVENN